MHEAETKKCRSICYQYDIIYVIVYVRVVVYVTNDILTNVIEV